MKKSLKLLLATGLFMAGSAQASFTDHGGDANKSDDFSEYQYMSRADDADMEVGVNFKHTQNPQLMKSRVVLYGMRKNVARLLKVIEDQPEHLNTANVPTWITTWAKSHNLQITISEDDDNNTNIGSGSADIGDNDGNNLNIIFGNDYMEAPMLSGVHFRWTPIYTVSPDGVKTVMAWGCSTDADKKKYSKSWAGIDTSGSFSEYGSHQDGSAGHYGFSNQGEQAYVVRGTGYPFYKCVSSTDMSIATASDIYTGGINTGQHMNNYGI